MEVPGGLAIQLRDMNCFSFVEWVHVSCIKLLPNLGAFRVVLLSSVLGKSRIPFGFFKKIAGAFRFSLLHFLLVTTSVIYREDLLCGSEQ